LPQSTLEALAAGAYELLKPICGSRTYLHILNRNALPLRHFAFITSRNTTMTIKSVSSLEKASLSKREQVIVILSGFCKARFR